MDEIGETMPAAPKDFDTRMGIGVACQEAAKLGNPADGLLQGRGRSRRERGLVDKAKKRFPFCVLESNGTRQSGGEASQIGEKEETPGDEVGQRQEALAGGNGVKASLFDTAATFKDKVKAFNDPP